MGQPGLLYDAMLQVGFGEATVVIIVIRTVIAVAGVPPGHADESGRSRCRTVFPDEALQHHASELGRTNVQLNKLVAPMLMKSPEDPPQALQPKAYTLCWKLGFNCLGFQGLGFRLNTDYPV